MRAAQRVAAKKVDWGRNKAITTQEKMLVADAARGGKAGGGKGCGGGMARAKVPGLTKVLAMQSRSAGWGVSKNGEVEKIPFTKRFVSVKVQRYRDQQARLEKKDEEPLDLTNGKGKSKKGKGKAKGKAKEKTKTTKAVESKAFPFLALPDEVKARIYRHAVVDSKLCIWPTSALGREQPDLSMVCKEIREGVLPIYYGENTFAVDIAPPITPVKDIRHVVPRFGQTTRRPLVGLVAVQRWAVALSDRRNEGGKWWGMVKHWCFSYQDPQSGCQSSKTAPSTRDWDGSFVVSVRAQQVDLMQGRYASSTGAVVEVHREAACIMPGWDDCGQCLLRPIPRALQAAVTSWLQTDETVLEELGDFVAHLRSSVEQLAMDRCASAAA
ncbi:hypothetical protein Slin15195_G041240 [Septoria linicola]|uniref:Uncharacterized protein n=1 Tax=Septoria linicola TaxID=215465 RepID=A0A9Q9EHA4_9PEZI|nr:hypothetical protein Slin15195_G041240 [Septoria linicola]